MITVDELFPERDGADEAMQAGAAAVCARLGRPVDEVEDGATSTVIAGVIDGERIAWVVQHWRDSGYEDIDGYSLHMRRGADERVWEVDTYNPWFGCTVHLMRWYGDELAVVYSEKHHTIACVLGFTGAPRLRVLDYRWQAIGDVLLYAGEARGLVERVRLPDLEICAPLPVEEARVDLSAGTCSLLAPLPTQSPGLWRQIALRLPAVDEVLIEVLIGALAYRFWEARPPVSTSYEAAYAAASGRWNPPCWLPFHWIRTRDAAQSRAAIAALDAVAARAPAAYDAADAPSELAARHIAARCAELAAACRADDLPEGTSCYFWVAWSQAEFAGAGPLFPPRMWLAYQGLRTRAAELLALTRRR